MIQFSTQIHKLIRFLLCRRCESPCGSQVAEPSSSWSCRGAELPRDQSRRHDSYCSRGPTVPVRVVPFRMCEVTPRAYDDAATGSTGARASISSSSEHILACTCPGIPKLFYAGRPPRFCEMLESSTSLRVTTTYLYALKSI